MPSINVGDRLRGDHGVDRRSQVERSPGQQLGAGPYAELRVHVTRGGRRPSSDSAPAPRRSPCCCVRRRPAGQPPPPGGSGRSAGSSAPRRPRSARPRRRRARSGPVRGRARRRGQRTGVRPRAGRRGPRVAHLVGGGTGRGSGAARRAPGRRRPPPRRRTASVVGQPSGREISSTDRQIAAYPSQGGDPCSSAPLPGGCLPPTERLVRLVVPPERHQRLRVVHRPAVQPRFLMERLAVLEQPACRGHDPLGVTATPGEVHRRVGGDSRG